MSRCLSLNGGLFDRVLIRLMERVFMSSDKPDYENARARTAEARKIYSSPALLAEPHTFFRAFPPPRDIRTQRLSKLRGGERLAVTFTSPYRCHDEPYQAEYAGYAGNAQHRIRYLTHGDPGRPTAIAIHSWCGGRLTMAERVFGARQLYRLGFDVALFTMPFHG